MDGFYPVSYTGPDGTKFEFSWNGKEMWDTIFVHSGDSRFIIFLHSKDMLAFIDYFNDLKRWST